MTKQVTDYAKQAKPALLALVTERDEAQGAAMLAQGRKVTKAVIVAWLEADDNRGRGMSDTLKRYRANYVDTVSSSNRPSLHNGDPVAKFLAGQDPAIVMAAAERILGLEQGFLQGKYASLNPGQQRMNAGNRIRAALKRGDITAAELKLVA